MGQIMRCAIVDDIADDIDRLAAMVAAYCAARAIDCECARFDSPAAFVSAYRSARFDVVFLDGYFDTLDSPADARTTGLDTARWLRRHGHDVPVVFTTVSVDFAVAGYGVDAAGYLVKPFSSSDLAAVLDKIVARMPGIGGTETAGPPVLPGSPVPSGGIRAAVRHPADVIDLPVGEHDAEQLRTRALVSTGSLATVVVPGPSGQSGSSGSSGPSESSRNDPSQPFLRVDASRLAYCRADLHRVAFHDVLEPRTPAFSVRMSFATLESALAGMPRFFVCARGYVVNLDCVAGFDGDAFVLSRGGVRVPVSRRRAAEARARYADHVFGTMRDDPPAQSAPGVPGRRP